MLEAILTESYSEILYTIITVLLGVITFIVRKYVKRRTEIDIGKFLDEKSIPEALELARKEVEEALKKHGKSMNKLEFENKIIQDAFDMVKEQYPIWLEEYGINEHNLYKWIKSKFKDN